MDEIDDPLAVITNRCGEEIASQIVPISVFASVLLVIDA
jgi:hypothetical protein